MTDEDVDYNKNGTQDEDEEAVNNDSRGGDDNDDPPKKHIRKKLSVKGGMRCHLANDDADNNLVGNEDAKACMVATVVVKKKEGIENSGGGKGGGEGGHVLSLVDRDANKDGRDNVDCLDGDGNSRSRQQGDDCP